MKIEMKKKQKRAVERAIDILRDSGLEIMRGPNLDIRMTEFNLLGKHEREYVVDVYMEFNLRVPDDCLIKR